MNNTGYRAFAHGLDELEVGGFMRTDKRQLRLPYTTAEVAEMCGKSTAFVLREIESGRLEARHKKGESKRWYVTEEALQKWASGGMLEEPAK